MSPVFSYSSVDIINPKAKLTNYYVWRRVFNKYKTDTGAKADCLTLRAGKDKAGLSFQHSNETDISRQTIEVHQRSGLDPDKPASRYLCVDAKELCTDVNVAGVEKISFHDDGGYPHINMRYSPAVLADSHEYLEVRTMIVEEAEYYEVDGSGKVSSFP